MRRHPSRFPCLNALCWNRELLLHLQYIQGYHMRSSHFFFWCVIKILSVTVVGAEVGWFLTHTPTQLWTGLQITPQSFKTTVLSLGTISAIPNFLKTRNFQATISACLPSSERASQPVLFQPYIHHEIVPTLCSEKIPMHLGNSYPAATVIDIQEDNARCCFGYHTSSSQPLLMLLYYLN